MINYLNGTLEHIDKISITVDVNGIGYGVNVPSSVMARLPGVGEKVKIFTCQIVREDEISLYGFLTREEKSLFVLLLTVSGIGPKAASSIISAFPIEKIVGAIAQSNFDLLSSVPGIGKKTAQKVVIELKEKVAKAYALSSGESMPGSLVDADSMRDAVAALMALGYSQREAREAITKAGVDPSSQSIEEIIKKVLQTLS